MKTAKLELRKGPAPVPDWEARLVEIIAFMTQRFRGSCAFFFTDRCFFCLRELQSCIRRAWHMWKLAQSEVSPDWNGFVDHVSRGSGQLKTRPWDGAKTMLFVSSALLTSLCIFLIIEK